MESNTLKKTIYDSLVSDISSGKYAANEILTEGRLMEPFGCSKAPVREALIELCKDSFLKSIPRLGYQVVPVSLKEVINILDFRTDMEVANLKRAFPRITKEKLDIFRINEASWVYENQPNLSIFQNWKKNKSFHLTLCSLSENAFTLQNLEKLLMQSSRFFPQYYTNAWVNETESKGRFHAQILNALESRDLNEACQLLSDDIKSVKDQILLILS
ncbi:GntR family transcriptional regulator [uncultured Sphaerochaeta sp.]|uniref:GntR family transcriptional regulator n=1 Tax=uncultured Sphaerochaeta sp. TaxID=886478 RepID=UPI002A0A42CA|nr:GntR family transcriptional regulator [uncultured Sphaerochaeta sp.]